MKRHWFAIYFCILLISGYACTRQQTPYFLIRYKGLNVPDGTVAYLWRCYGDGNWDIYSRPIQKSIVKNGQIEFKGLEDTTHIYRIELNGNSLPFYPESGELSFTYGTSFEHPVSATSTKLLSLNVQFWELQQTQETNVLQKRKMLFSNIQNAMGCYLLNQTIIYPDELQKLYDKTNDTMRSETPVLKTLSATLNQSQLLEKGDLFINYTWVNKQKDSTYLSDRIGKGKPVALFFWTDKNEKLPLYIRIKELAKQMPDIQPIIITRHVYNPSAILFLRQLEKEGSLISEDNRPYKHSLFAAYRIFNQNFNYEYVFNSQGILVNRNPLAYFQKDVYKKLENALLTAIYESGKNQPFAHYIQLTEYKALLNFIRTNPQGILMLLDGDLLKTNPDGLSGRLTDQLLRDYCPQAPSLTARLHAVKDNMQIAAIIQQYTYEILPLIKGNDSNSITFTKKTTL